MWSDRTSVRYESVRGRRRTLAGTACGASARCAAGWRALAGWPVRVARGCRTSRGRCDHGWVVAGQRRRFCLWCRPPDRCLVARRWRARWRSARPRDVGLRRPLGLDRRDPGRMGSRRSRRPVGRVRRNLGRMRLGRMRLGRMRLDRVRLRRRWPSGGRMPAVVQRPAVLRTVGRGVTDPVDGVAGCAATATGACDVVPAVVGPGDLEVVGVLAWELRDAPGLELASAAVARRPEAVSAVVPPDAGRGARGRCDVRRGRGRRQRLVSRERLGPGGRGASRCSCPRCRDDRGCDDRDLRRDRHAERAAAHRRRRSAGCRARGTRTAGGSRGAGLHGGRAVQHVAEQGGGAGNGQGRRQCVEIIRPLGEGKVKRATACAAGEVCAQSAATPNATVSVGEHASNLSAVHPASLREFAERHARFEDRLLDGAPRGPDDRRDLLVREATELPQHQRLALALGQLREVRPELLQPLAIGDDLARRSGRGRVAAASSSTVGRRWRTRLIASLCAIRNSHGRSSKSRCSLRSASRALSITL